METMYYFRLVLLDEIMLELSIYDNSVDLDAFVELNMSWLESDFRFLAFLTDHQTDDTWGRQSQTKGFEIRQNGIECNHIVVKIFVRHKNKCDRNHHISANFSSNY